MFNNVWDGILLEFEGENNGREAIDYAQEEEGYTYELEGFKPCFRGVDVGQAGQQGGPSGCGVNDGDGVAKDGRCGSCSAEGYEKADEYY